MRIMQKNRPARHILFSKFVTYPLSINATNKLFTNSSSTYGRYATMINYKHVVFMIWKKTDRDMKYRNNGKDVNEKKNTSETLQPK